MDGNGLIERRKVNDAGEKGSLARAAPFSGQRGYGTRQLVFDENVGLFLAVVVKLAWASEFTQELVETQNSEEGHEHRMG